MPYPYFDQIITSDFHEHQNLASVHAMYTNILIKNNTGDIYEHLSLTLANAISAFWSNK